MASPSSHLSNTSDVEIRSEEPGLKGAWFSGTVLRTPTHRKAVSVQFKTLLDEKGKKPLKEYVDPSNVRPLPPQEEVREPDRGFEVGEAVDAFTNDGWWEGVITKLVDESRFFVRFNVSNEESVFEKNDLRVHKDWVDGSWVAVPAKVAVNLEKPNVRQIRIIKKTRDPDVVIRGSFKVYESLDTDILERQLDAVTKKRKESQLNEINLQAIIMSRQMMEETNNPGSPPKKPKMVASKANAQTIPDTEEQNNKVQNEQQDNDASKIKKETRDPDMIIRGSFMVYESLDTDTLERQLDTDTLERQLEAVTKKRKELQQKEINLHAIIMARQMMEETNNSGSPRKKPKKAASKVRWDEHSSVPCPEKVSPWKIESALTPTLNTLQMPRPKRPRVPSSPDSTVLLE